MLVALLGGAGAGAAVTARHAAATERVRVEADRGARAVLALRAGRPSLQDGTPRLDPQEPSTLRLNVPVSNRGADRVRITVRGVDVRGQAPLPVAPGVSSLALAPGATTTASVPVVVRCADVVPDARAGARRSALRVSVDMPGGPRRAALPLEDSVPGAVSGLLSYACGPPEQHRSPLSVTWTPRDDGSLEALVVGPATPGRFALDLRQTPGLGVRSDVELPVETTERSPTTLVLTMEPTCSVAAPPGRVPVVSLEVLTLVDGQVQASLPDDGGIKAAWTARQLALRCG